MTRPQPPAQRQTALITGASSGIGLDLARILAEHRYDVVLVARSGDVLGRACGELPAAHGISATAFPLDLNVASTAAFQPGPVMAVYYATKAYALSFSQAVAEEVRDTGVTITALCPGPTHTNFAAVANMATTRLFRSGLVKQSYPVARAGLEGTMRGDRVVIPGLLNRVGALGATLAPRGLVTRLSRLVQERR